MSRELVVSLPALDDVLAGRLPAPDGLARILGFGRIERGGGDAALAGELGLRAIPSAGPRAALAAGDAPAPGSSWLRVDPVHLQPDLTAVWLRQGAGLDWSAPSMVALHAALHELFDLPGMDWRPPSTGEPGRIALAELPDSVFVPLHAAIGRRLDEILPRGPAAARWHGLINEAQMTFHQFRALDDPRSSGLGLWFWGAGVLPDSPASHSVVRVVAAGDAAEAGGLARWLGMEADPAAGFDDLPGTTLVEATLGSDAPERLAVLDAELFEPAWQALRGGRLRSIRVIGVDRRAAAGRWSPFAFWRGSFHAVEES